MKHTFKKATSLMLAMLMVLSGLVFAPPSFDADAMNYGGYTVIMTVDANSTYYSDYNRLVLTYPGDSNVYCIYDDNNDAGGSTDSPATGDMATINSRIANGTGTVEGNPNTSQHGKDTGTFIYQNATYHFSKMEFQNDYPTNVGKDYTLTTTFKLNRLPNAIRYTQSIFNEAGNGAVSFTARLVIKDSSGNTIKDSGNVSSSKGWGTGYDVWTTFYNTSNAPDPAKPTDIIVAGQDISLTQGTESNGGLLYTGEVQANKTTATSVNLANLIVKDQYGYVLGCDYDILTNANNYFTYTEGDANDNLKVTFPVDAQSGSGKDSSNYNFKIKYTEPGGDDKTVKFIITLKDAIYDQAFHSQNKEYITNQYAYNSETTLPTAPTRDTWTFLGWYSSQNGDYTGTGTPNPQGTKLVEGATITADQTWYAAWAKTMYKITLHDTIHDADYDLFVPDGQTMSGAGVAMPTISPAPKMVDGVADSEVHIAHSAWDGLDMSATVSADATYTNTTKEVAHNFSEIISTTPATCTTAQINTMQCDCGCTKDVEVGNPLGHDVPEFVDGTSEGWTQVNPSSVGVPGDYTAVCERCNETVHRYTPAKGEIKFVKNVDGTDEVLATFTEDEGETLGAAEIVALSNVNTSIAPTQITYTFKGWSADKDADWETDSLLKVNDFNGEEFISGTKTYYAIYETKGTEYTVNYSIDGETYKSLTVQYGQNIWDTLEKAAGDDFQETKKDDTKVYTYAGWKVSGSSAVVADTATFTAGGKYDIVYDSATRYYSVALPDGKTKAVEYNTTLQSAGVDSSAWTKTADTNNETQHDVFGGWIIVVDGENKDALTTPIKADGLEVTEYRLVEDHKYDEAVTVPATTEAAGEKYEICSVCGHKHVIETYPELKVVTFVGFDGDTALYPVQVPQGSTLAQADIPTATKASTAEFTYTFTSWQVNGVDVDLATYAVDEDVTITAEFEESTNQYTVTFTDELGVATGLQTVNYGTEITVPSVATTTVDHKVYTFKNWNVSGTTIPLAGGASYKVIKDVELVAKYDVTDEMVTLTLNDTPTEYAYGTVVTLPVLGTIELGETISTHIGWTADMDDETAEVFTGEYTLTESITLYSKYENTIKEYPVELKGFDGAETIMAPRYTLLAEILPENPTKAEDANYTYTFKNWSVNSKAVDLENDVVTGDMIITAEFEAVAKTVEITFKDGSGDVIETKQIAVGTVLTADIFPEVEEYTFNNVSHKIFSEWQVNGATAAGQKAAAGMVVKAAYSDWLAHDFEKVTTPATCEHPGEEGRVCKICGYAETVELPTLAHDAEWVIITPAGEGKDGEKQLVCKDCEKVLETQVIPMYRVYRFYRADGSLHESQQFDNGFEFVQTLTPKVVKEVEGSSVVYTFSHWENEDGVAYTFPIEVSSSLNFYPVFTESENLTVEFKVDDANTVTKTFEKGHVLTASDFPTKTPVKADPYYDYIFTMWVDESGNEVKVGTALTTNMVLEPEFERVNDTLKTYTVSYALSKDEVLSTYTFDAGTSKEEVAKHLPTLTAEQKLINLGETGHKQFSSWSYQFGDEGVVADTYVMAVYNVAKHDFEVTSDNTKQDCTKGGEIVEVCTVCGEKVVTTVAAKADHDFQPTEETYTKDGVQYRVYKCENCECTKDVKVGEESEDTGDVEGTYTITVPVMFDDHTPAVGVDVKLYRDGKYIDTQKTNEKGEATFTVTMSGKYTVSVTGETSDGRKIDGEFSCNILVNKDGSSEVTGMQAVKEYKCACMCHKNTFWAKIFRFFQGFVKFFTGEYRCCDCPDPMYG